MASFLAHGATALVAAEICSSHPIPTRLRIFAVICSILPDADVIGFEFGIEYRDLLGHRGLSHSILFAVMIGLLVARFLFREPEKFGWKRRSLFWFFFCVTLSHGFLDALTNGGLGIAFFSPFNSTRYFFPWTPIEVSPFSIEEFFSAWGWEIFLNELIYVGIPLALILGIVKWKRYRMPR